MRHGIVDPKTGKVVNVVLWEGHPWQPPAGHYVVQHDSIDIDDDYDINNKQLKKRNRTARDISQASVAALEAEIAIKQRELTHLKSQLV
jgi:uncharacterized small protein (DUF1192 family)